jgi:hypothetical protein
VLNRFIHIALITFILLGQIGDKFAVAAMPCEGKANGEMRLLHESMLHENMSHANTSDAAMDAHMMISNNMDDSCCEQDCCCPMAIVLVAALIENTLSTSLDFKNPSAIIIENGLYFTFLALPKQPPKSFYSLAG